MFNFIFKLALKSILIGGIYISFASGQSWDEVDDFVEKKDFKNAISMLKEMGEEGDPAAYLEIGFIYLFEKGMENDKKAYSWVKKSAENGHAHGKYALSVLFFSDDDRGVAQDKKEEIWWLRSAAVQGHKDAQYYLGLYHSNVFLSDSQDVPHSFREGLRWLELAAENGKVEAMEKLGELFEKGDINGRYQDDERASYWFDRASEHEDA